MGYHRALGLIYIELHACIQVVEQEFHNSEAPVVSEGASSLAVRLDLPSQAELLAKVDALLASLSQEDLERTRFYVSGLRHAAWVGQRLLAHLSRPGGVYRR